MPFAGVLKSTLEIEGEQLAHCPTFGAVSPRDIPLVDTSGECPLTSAFTGV